MLFYLNRRILFSFSFVYFVILYLTKLSYTLKIQLQLSQNLILGRSSALQ